MDFGWGKNHLFFSVCQCVMGILCIKSIPQQEQGLEWGAVYSGQGGGRGGTNFFFQGVGDRTNGQGGRGGQKFFVPKSGDFF